MGEKDLRKGVSLLICFRDWMWSKHVLSLRSLDLPPPRARATALSLLEQALSGKPNWRSCPWGISRASAVSFRSVNDMSRAFLHPCDACEFLRCTDWKKRACQAREKGETCGRPALLLPSLLPPPPFLSTFFLQGSGVAMRTGSLWGSLGPPCW